MSLQSSNISVQSDYQETMRLITNMLEKPESNAGSVILGKSFANFYNDAIKKLLLTDTIDMRYLKELQSRVSLDLTMVRVDCAKRVRSTNTIENDIMMSMITDFILSL
jgi:hypothetical protein